MNRSPTAPRPPHARPSISPEAKLVLALAARDRETIDTVLAQEFESAIVERIARNHQVAGLCWLAALELRRENPTIELLPPRTLTFFGRSFAVHELRNRELAGTLCAIAQAFERERIDVLFFKGPWLAFHAYPASGARPVGDIDIGIDERDYARALSALASLDYDVSRARTWSASTALRTAHYREQIRLAAPRRPLVELHFRMINIGPPRSEAWIRESVRTIDVEGVPLRVPGPVPMLLHLLIHANQHGFAPLRLLHDIRFAFEADGQRLDMETLTRAIRDLHCNALAYHALVLARDLAGAAVPTVLLEAVRPGSLRAHMYSRLWHLDDVRALESTRVHNSFEAPRLYLLEMGSWFDKARFLAGVALHVADRRVFTKASND